MSSEKERITKSAGMVGSLTFLSRIAGYLRDMAIAYFFGATAVTDAFWVAFRTPNILRRLFAEGTLTISFIPVFTESMEKRGIEEAKKIADTVFTLLFIILLAVSALGMIFSPVIVKLFAYGFDRETFELSVTLMRIMFPYIFFISLTALCMGVLNSLRHFFAPAISPVLFNICIIAAILLLNDRLGAPIYSAAAGVLIGGAMQLFLQIPFLRKKGVKFRFSTNFRHPAVKKIGLLVLPQLFGVAVYNFNIIVNTQYASFMKNGTISYLYFSERLTEFPLGIIAVSIATVLLPSLSTYISKGEFDKFKETYSFTLKLMLFIVLPALAGLIALRIPICNLLYQRGEFTYSATVFTSQALLGYAVGLWAVGGIRITAPAFYAMQDTKTPVIIAFFAFIINAVLGFVLGFTFDLNHTGLALASSVSSIFNFILLFYMLERKTGRLDLKSVLSFYVKVLALAVVMGLIAWRISEFADWTKSGFTILKLLTLAAAILVSASVYFGLAKLLRLEEPVFLIDMIRRKGSGKRGAGPTQF